MQDVRACPEQEFIGPLLHPRAPKPVVWMWGVFRFRVYRPHNMDVSGPRPFDMGGSGCWHVLTKKESQRFQG